MKPLPEYLKDKIMNYRQILTYNFSDNDTRTSFEDLLNDNGYIKAEDQSTYVLPYDSGLRVSAIKDKIIDWSSAKETMIDASDFVQIFFLSEVKAGAKVIIKMSSKFLKFDSKTKGLI